MSSGLLNSRAKKVASTVDAPASLRIAALTMFLRVWFVVVDHHETCQSIDGRVGGVWPVSAGANMIDQAEKHGRSRRNGGALLGDLGSFPSIVGGR